MERNIIKDINHKVADKLVEIAKESNAGIKLEQLYGIRNSRKVCCIRYREYDNGLL